MAVRSAGIARANACQRPSPDLGKRPLTCAFIVGVASFRLNPALASYLRKRAEGRLVADPVEPPAHAATPSYVARPWRLVDRLDEAQISALIEAFLSGTPKHVLAKQYSVSLTAIKDLLRARGVRGKNRGGRRNRRSG